MKQFLNGRMIGPIGMSEEKGETQMVQEQALVDAGHHAGGVEDVEGIVPQMVATPGMPYREATTRRQNWGREIRHTPSYAAQIAIYFAGEDDLSDFDPVRAYGQSHSWSEPTNKGSNNGNRPRRPDSVRHLRNCVAAVSRSPSARVRFIDAGPQRKLRPFSSRGRSCQTPRRQHGHLVIEDCIVRETVSREQPVRMDNYCQRHSDDKAHCDRRIERPTSHLRFWLSRAGESPAAHVGWKGNIQMRVVFDRSLCAAHGDCVVVAPDVFDLGDDDDVAILLNENPPEDQRTNVEMAINVCPVGAIRIR